jgi:peptidoglycan/xylan/chitin deacetylase (PgdA/CDA1 family)
MLKPLKQLALRSFKTIGGSTVLQNSRWRRQRLLILAYHGISMCDEHQWNQSGYLPPDIFRSRLQQLKDSRCNVLCLNDAIERLYANDLPDRSVAITFDDGTADFYRRAFPIIKEFDVPTTLYLTTFYSHYQRPVFDLMCSYLLWKGRNETLDLKRITAQNQKITLSATAAQDGACTAILDFARTQGFSAEEKDDLLTSLARTLKVDYESLLNQRVLQLLTRNEVSQLDASRIDVQLHTHRHRTPKNRELFIREIEDNRKSIQAMTGKRALHFCYPSGVHDPAFLPWLKESGVVSATTCEPGLASTNSDRLLLPRFLDNSALAPIEFEGWLTGISAALPRRQVPGAATAA